MNKKVIIIISALVLTIGAVYSYAMMGSGMESGSNNHMDNHDLDNQEHINQQGMDHTDMDHANMNHEIEQNKADDFFKE